MYVGLATVCVCFACVPTYVRTRRRVHRYVRTAALSPSREIHAPSMARGSEGSEFPVMMCLTKNILRGCLARPAGTILITS